ncbi:MAG: DEAD/DEAH box helicase [Alphaproteobacteria bacterium]|nr:DEAD/DEAH box helicase [Alphaproteobacteria bacterium]
MVKTIKESIEELHKSLCEYIEATYHIGDEGLIRQRRHLLNATGVIHQSPYLESTPRYAPGPKFSEISGLPKAALRIYEALSQTSGRQRRIFYDPPYQHQAAAIEGALVGSQNLVIMTGTGSGKTESFLLPILGKLAREAEQRPQSFAAPAVRAILLYPMNALVNDQLGRLRSLFGDTRLASLFDGWTGRRPRFARYTSRTPYAGVRSKKKDQQRLRSFEDFYVDIERAAADPESDDQASAERVQEQLKSKGKWPAKLDLRQWYGSGEWQDRRTKEFIRANALPDDAELITRDEVQKDPPDLLVTNYSMLEYMLMRPIERPIFDKTRDWLAANPSERLMIVLDEAHLYRGAAGAEVGLLLRRLRERLGITADRFQVICATASFDDKDYAREFGAQLSGASPDSFRSITSSFAYRPGATPGSPQDAAVLADIDLDAFYEGADDLVQTRAVQSFLAYRGTTAGDTVDAKLYHALEAFGPLGLVVNETMGKALPIASLGELIFPSVENATADRALTALLALGSRARLVEHEPGLLPCRVHTFFRGLPGLWVCMDPQCTELPEIERGGPCGKMYSQPREKCRCESRVLEYYTCRNCGGSYARAYTDDVVEPQALWSSAGKPINLAGGGFDSLEPLDLLLEEPADGTCEEALYDLDTGRLNPKVAAEHTRSVFLRLDRHAPPPDEDGNATGTATEPPGKFVPCGLCGQRAGFNRTSVQDHQTKGDQPFQTLLSRQIHIQPPGPPDNLRFAPLRGRKVLVFSDSRQVAARLAPNLQMYSVRDALRPLLVWGFDRLQRVDSIRPLCRLSDAYFAVLLAANALGVRLRPELASGESFATNVAIERAMPRAVQDDEALHGLWMEHRTDHGPRALMEEIHRTITDRFLGLEALALGSLAERPNQRAELAALPALPGLADTTETKIAVTRAWLRCWLKQGIWFEGMPQAFWGNEVKGSSGKFPTAMNRLLNDAAKKKIFRDGWLPALTTIFLDQSDSPPRILAKNLSIELGGDWVRCPSCRSVHRPLPDVTRCLDCDIGVVAPLEIDKDEAFIARKSYYRRSVAAALADPPVPPMALIAAEHTAQLNSTQNNNAFSKAEENELLFQDVDIAWRANARAGTAIDILSSTTTMEVGIDIGALSGVALRNMPPGRANYQQRAGRAGRRGNAVATVVAFGSSDSSHDEHYFREPADMISGPVVDPRLTLDNPDIAKRHVYGYFLQRFHEATLPGFDPSAPPDLFSVLGTVANFRTGRGILNRNGFAAWLQANRDELRSKVDGWLPAELPAAARSSLLATMFDSCLAEIDKAIEFDPAASLPPEGALEEGIDEEEADTDPAATGEDQIEADPNRAMLLDRLLYSGVLPRYAFPTDVSTFHVFDRGNSKGGYPVFSFTPAQGLPIALSQYAPGRQVWISGKCYTSGAIYSRSKDARRDAWADKEIYFQCQVCGFAKTGITNAQPGDLLDCEACGASAKFGPGRWWLRPVGFAHPIDVIEETSPDNVPESSRATRAKLTMHTPDEGESWTRSNERLRSLRTRTHLLVSNIGPDNAGYSYCTSCGRIESSVTSQPLLGSAHRRPYPTKVGEENCPGGFTSPKIVLGTKFITDIALFSMQFEEPVCLRPDWFSTHIALRTLSEALALSACRMLEIEPGEIMAEYRPALTPRGPSGHEAEIFLYDTLPGGAGFTSQLVGNTARLFGLAEEILTGCEGHCQSSCYRCLRSFTNKFEHAMLDRHIGAALLAYLLRGELPTLGQSRVDASAGLLEKDLRRRADQGLVYETGMPVTLPGGGTVTAPLLATRTRDNRQFAIALSGPLTPDLPLSPDMRVLESARTPVGLIIVDELLTRMNLPAATRQVLEQLGG